MLRLWKCYFLFGTYTKSLQCGERCFSSSYIWSVFKNVALITQLPYKKKCKVYSAAGLTIDSKCEASSQTRKSKSTSMRQYPLCNLQLQEKEQKKKSFKLLETWKRNESALFIYLLLDTVCEHIQKRSLGRLLHHWAARRRSWLWSVRQSRDSPRRASPQTPGIKTDVMGVLSNAISSKWCN